MSTPEELLTQSLAKLQTANRIDGTRASYRKDSPAEYLKVIAYLQGGARPSRVVSDMGMGLMLAEDARRGLVVEPPPPPPPPPPSTWPASYFTGPAGQGNLLPSKQGVLLGTIADAAYGYSGIPGYYSAFETYLGRTLDIEHRFWNDACTIDPPLVSDIVSRGHIPMFSWSPVPNNGGRILAGEADNCIRSVGQQIGALPHKIILRIFWEFNGNWMPWSKKADGSMLTTAEFTALWKKTVDLLREGGAFTKASIVWNPHGGYYNRPVWIDAREVGRQLGDTYFDWVSEDEYNVVAAGGWTEFGALFSRTNATERDFRGRKPFMVCETGCLEGTSGQKGQWFRNARDFIKNGGLPGLHAITYFDYNYPDGNWRIDSTSTSKQGFKDWALDPYFNTRS